MPANTFAQFGQSRDSLAALDQHQSQNRQQLDQFQRARQSALQTGDETERLDLEIAILEAAQSDAAVRITQIRNGFQDLATQAFAAPDAVIGTLDTGVPMALLPVRIETRFNGPTQLQLRIYPDQVHIHSHIDAVTEAEAALARTYWSGVWQANGSDAAWTDAATALGPERAKYVLDRFRPSGLDGRNPNSYSGIFWTLGRFDRPWGPVRPIFGTIRYMSSDSTRKKLDLRAYLARFQAAGSDAQLSFFKT